MFHRLVGWTVFSIAHCFVCEDEDGGQLHKSREPDGGPGVITEDEERRTEGAELRQGEAIYDGSHGMFTDAEMQVLTARTFGLNTARALIGQCRFVRRPKIRRASKEPRDVLRQNV